MWAAGAERMHIIDEMADLPDHASATHVRILHPMIRGNPSRVDAIQHDERIRTRGEERSRFLRMRRKSAVEPHHQMQPLGRLLLIG